MKVVVKYSKHGVFRYEVVLLDEKGKQIKHEVCDTFIGDDHVIKVPYNSYGIKCNITEAEWDHDEIPLAKCELIDGIPGFTPKLLKMERVEPVPGATHVREYSEKFEYPDWVNNIDGYQCGFNSLGDLVAFDL